MSKVVKFPSQELKEENLFKQLDSTVNTLYELYESLNNVHAEMHKLEMEASRHEKQVDVLIKQYAEVGDLNNLPDEILAYSSKAEVMVDGEGYSINWVDGDD